MIVSAESNAAKMCIRDRREAEIGICVVEMEVSEQKDYIRNLISEGDADNVIGFYDSYSVAKIDKLLPGVLFL